jgi:hypothetical protein
LRAPEPDVGGRPCCTLAAMSGKHAAPEEVALRLARDLSEQGRQDRRDLQVAVHGSPDPPDRGLSGELSWQQVARRIASGPASGPAINTRVWMVELDVSEHGRSVAVVDVTPAQPYRVARLTPVPPQQRWEKECGRLLRSS